MMFSKFYKSISFSLDTTPYLKPKMECQNYCQSGQKHAQVAIVMVPFPSQSHLSQVLHLSHLIITSYGIPVHYAGSALHNLQAKQRLLGWDPENTRKIQFHDLELPPFSSAAQNSNASSHFPAHLQSLWDATTHLQQPMFELLQQLSTKFRRIIVIHDVLMGSVVQDAKLIPNAESYSLYPVSAFYMFLHFWGTMTEKPFQLDSEIPKATPPIDGCFTPEFGDFLENQFTYSDFQSGRLYNTCRVIEGKYVELLERLPMNANMKHFALGPFIPTEIKCTSEKPTHGCLEWLDKQEKHSVIYVFLGTASVISTEQIRELALGLEQSGQKFIWVLRPADKADIFTEDEQSPEQLPEGYEERMKNRGIVVRDWAPQLEILAHPSTGGFMSHCGWNSCLESTYMGVPIAAWPLHSDQPRNMALVTEILRIGMVVRDWADRSQLVPSHRIQHAVQSLMASEEGDEIRKRAQELGKAVRESFGKGGASSMEMESFIAHITR